MQINSTTTAKEKKLFSTDVDQSIIEQDLKIFEMENLIDQLQKLKKHQDFKIEELSNQLQCQNEEKRKWENRLFELQQSSFSFESIKNKEISSLQEDLIGERQKRIKIQENFDKTQEEISILKEYLKEMEEEKKNWLKNEEIINNERTSENLSFDRIVENLKNENERLENEKKRLQEEMDILVQTYNYEINDIKQLKERNEHLQKKVNFFQVL